VVGQCWRRGRCTCTFAASSGISDADWYRPASGSGCIGQGSASGITPQFVVTDLNGTLRGTPPTAGAVEP
jgi:hypothetical protein